MLSCKLGDSFVKLWYNEVGCILGRTHTVTLGGVLYAVERAVQIPSNAVSWETKDGMDPQMHIIPICFVPFYFQSEFLEW